MGLGAPGSCEKPSTQNSLVALGEGNEPNRQDSRGKGVSTWHIISIVPYTGITVIVL